MFDITKFDTKTLSEKGVEMKVRNPSTGTPFRDDKGDLVTITLYGRNSAVYRTAEREVRERALIRAKAGTDPLPEELQDDVVEFLCAVTKTWTNLARGGEEYPPLPENIRAFWSDPRWGWLARQAETFSAGEGNFLAP